MKEHAQGGLSASKLAESLLELGCNHVYRVPDSTLEPVLAALASLGRHASHFREGDQGVDFGTHHDC
jgi:hypothetical protein